MAYDSTMKQIEKHEKELCELNLQIEATISDLNTEQQLLQNIANRGCYTKNKNEQLEDDLCTVQRAHECLKLDVQEHCEAYARCSGQNEVSKMIKANVDKAAEKKKTQDRSIRLTLDRHRKKEKEILEQMNYHNTSRKVCQECRSKTFYSHTYQPGQKSYLC